MGNKIITINSRKYNEAIRRTWKAKLIQEKGSLITLVGKFEEEVNHPDIGIIRRGTISYEFYWLDRWYNVFRFHEPEGEIRNFYGNINMPPKFKNSFLDYIDLDVDLYVLKDFSYQILDLEEFEDNARIYSYTSDLKAKVKSSLNELIFMVENRIFPFDCRL